MFFTDNDKLLLSKGLEFATTPKDLIYADYSLPFEFWYRDIDSLKISNSDIGCNEARFQDPTFSSCKESSKFMENNLPKAEFGAFKFLIGNKELIIQKADKGIADEIQIDDCKLILIIWFIW